MRRRYTVVDVFGRRPLDGNPLAVVIDSNGLTDEQMQRIARWTNLSETTFLLPPDDPRADYRVRIFTTSRELDFAGHPTLGSCHAWLATNEPRDPQRIIQECPAGLVDIRHTDRLAFAAPPLIRSGPVDGDDAATVRAVLGLEPDEVVDMAWADNGPGWVVVLLADAESVLDVEPVASAVEPLSIGSLDVGLVGPHPEGSEFAFEVRALFADGTGVLREDPVTGSLNASAAQWLLTSFRASAPYVARQGTKLGREGLVHITTDDDHVWAGGTTTTVIEGHVDV